MEQILVGRDSPNPRVDPVGHGSTEGTVAGPHAHRPAAQPAREGPRRT